MGQRYFAGLGRRSAADQSGLRSPDDAATGKAASPTDPFRRRASRLPNVSSWFPSASCNVIGGIIDGIRRASIVCPTRRPDHQYVVPAGRRDLQRPFHMRQPPDVAEIDVEPFGIFPESSFEIDRCPRKGMLPAQESDHLAQMTGSVNLQRSDDRRLRRILFR